MKQLLTSTFFCSLLLASFGLAHAQDGQVKPVNSTQDQNTETEGMSMVLVGALSASVTQESIDFANLPSGRVVKVGKDGVQVTTPEGAPSVPMEVPRLGTNSVHILPEAEKRALARKLQTSYDQIMTAYDDGAISEDDTLAIVKFMYDMELPYSETFRTSVERRFPTIQPQPGPTPPELFELDDTQVTDPIDTTSDYFTP
ncbi:hypothetical protein [Puniceicoccus vermicola]|uniref:DUF4168 domain-containing protein n=1 Tax=Puniceicoccus vermicola TaxID=388746 RepID=A0A7X1AV88_9BACT|nr:hypothetical protein [Puniceicoccus vermicola]MBC2600354.1 hypothetical protein [Puniceicoccus vermicola]